MCELVKRSIRALTSRVNVATGIVHPLDEALAKELFNALHADETPLIHADIEGLALADGWPECHAESLAELAERIGNGGRVVVKHPRNWGKATVARLKAEIASGKA